MPLECFLQKGLDSLRAFDALGEEALADIKTGDRVKVSITRPRNIKFHNKFFALLAILFPHQSYYPTPSKFRKAVTIALGFCEETVLPSGKIMVEPTSIAFHLMGDEDFELFMKRFFELAETRILPGIDRKDVEREWQEIMAGYGFGGSPQEKRAGADRHIAGTTGSPARDFSEEDSK